MKRFLTILIVILLGCVFLLLRPSKINDELCSVYESFFENNLSTSLDFIDPVTVSLITPNEFRVNGNQEFLSETGEYETVSFNNYENEEEQFERPIFDKFIFDLNKFPQEKQVKGNRKLVKCFRSIDVKYNFLKKDIYEILDNYKSNNIDMIPYVKKWHLSEIILSEDKSHALLFTDMYCGALCGESGYHLFESIEGRWTYKGFKILTVS